MPYLYETGREDPEAPPPTTMPKPVEVDPLEPAVEVEVEPEEEEEEVEPEVIKIKPKAKALNGPPNTKAVGKANKK